MLAKIRPLFACAAVMALSMAPSIPAAAPAPAPAQAAAEKQPAAVDINTATADELEALPGIGPAVARRIVEYRDANGPFQSPEEIMNVKGIGEKTYLRLKPLIKAGGSAGK